MDTTATDAATGKTMAELLPELLADGFDGVLTFGGKVPLASFCPYGIGDESGVNYRAGDRLWHGRREGDFLVDVPEEQKYCPPASPYFMLGRWPLTRSGNLSRP